MSNYRDFIKEIVETLGKERPDIDPHLETRQNQSGAEEEYLLLDAKSDEKARIVPAIPLVKCWDIYQQEGNFKEIIDAILYSVDNAPTNLAGVSVEDFSDYGKIKDRLCLKLMNCDNEALDGVIYFRYLDLAIAYICYSEADPRGQHQSILVREDFAGMWNVSVEDIIKQAVDNATKIMTPKILSMDSILKDSPFARNDRFTKNMYILTNEDRFLGAVVMTFPGVLSGLADELDSDLVILPASTHEVIVIPERIAGDTLMACFDEIVRDANNTVIDPIDYLSDHKYIYKRDSETLEY